MWESVDECLALLELLSSGKLKLRRAQQTAFAVLSELPWTRATGRRDEVRLVEEHRHDLVALLRRVWPDWNEALAALTALGEPPTPDGWRRVLDAQRAGAMPELPAFLNRRTAAALSAPHSKARLTGARRAALRDTEPTHDGTVRLRPPRGLRASTRKGAVDLSAIADVLGEAGIPERAFLDGLSFEGTIRAVLLVENLGAWRDLAAPDGWLLAHVPGWDTPTAERLLDCLANVPTVHFGDLDPNGVAIYLRLRERRPDLGWFVPSFWLDLAEVYGLRTQWSPDFDLGFAPEGVRDLACRGLWLEQEAIVLDPRVPEALEAQLNAARVGLAGG